MYYHRENRYRERWYEDGFTEYIQQLIGANRLEGASLGIAKKVVRDSVDSLSKKQKTVFEQHVMKHYYVKECEIGGHEIEWLEMYEALDTEICNYCEHKLHKFMTE